METTQQWIEANGVWEFGEARGEDHEHEFLINTFGAGADPEAAIAAIVAAMRLNKMICIRKSDETAPVVKVLSRQKRIQCAPNIGFDFEALSVVGIKPEKPKPGFLARLLG